MGKITYYDLAENDYHFLKDDYESGKIGNLLCSTAQNICERYLKDIINEYCRDVDTTTILRTHSLKGLRSFIRQYISDFSCNWNIIMQADGYYFSARYPGDEAFLVGKEDVDSCWEAVEYTREMVMNYKNRYCKTEDEEKEYDDRFLE